MVKRISKARSFEGWSLKQWSKRNKDNLKALILLLLGYNYFTGFNPVSLVTAILAIVAKLAVDTFDFWVSDVNLD